VSYALSACDASFHKLTLKRFCIIRYFFEDDDGVKKFHAQWFTHSSKTLLQQAGHSHALYLMICDCSDVEIDAISQKCNVRDLPMDGFQPDESNIKDDNDFHSGYAASYSDVSCNIEHGSQTSV
jgi:DNA (cytosine-5)-methyltransferase 1